MTIGDGASLMNAMTHQVTLNSLSVFLVMLGQFFDVLHIRRLGVGILDMDELLHMDFQCHDIICNIFAGVVFDPQCKRIEQPNINKD